MTDQPKSATAPQGGYLLPATPHGDRAWLDHARHWQDHVAAGRIGVCAGMDAAVLAQIRHNEAVVLGWTPSFPAVPAGRGR
jgi:hypothetical protein